MNAEKTVLLAEKPVKNPVQPPRRDSTDVDDQRAKLQDLVSEIRLDASVGAIDYLVRSNTSHDGE